MSKQLIHDAVTASLRSYFKDLGTEPPVNVYDLMLDAFEYPLLVFVMEQTHHNQSKAAKMLGLNRNTLRKKLQHHQLSN
jgi:Fis family transcriptional regulator